jgi:hypothetical protein
MYARATTLLYATYLGGNGTDDAKALAVNVDGEAFVTGETLSTDFPVTPGAFQRQLVAWSNAFVTRLNADGSALVYSTYLGGSTVNNIGSSISLAAGNEAVVAGRTYAPDFPITRGAFRTTYGGGSEAFVTKLNATGTSLVASTFFGDNTSIDVGLYVNVHSAGFVTLGGWTQSVDLPVTPNAFQSTRRGVPSAFIAILDSNLSRLVYGTYYGGSRSEAYLNFAQDIAGNLVIMGRTSSPDLPGARGRLVGTLDIFVAVFDPVRLVTARYLNTPDGAAPFEVNLDPAGIITFSGNTLTGFPTTPGAWQLIGRTPGGGFVARLGPDLNLWYGSYFGGSVGDASDTLSRTRDGWTLLGGRGASPDMPTPGVFNTTLRGINDAFLARMDLLPTGVNRYGRSSGACLGPIVMDVTRMPGAGAPDFTIVCSAAPPSATGWLLLGVAPDASGTQILGARLHVDVSRLVVAVPTNSSATGFGSVTLPLDQSWRGRQAYAQFVWINSANCPGNGFLSSTPRKSSLNAKTCAAWKVASHES